LVAALVLAGCSGKPQAQATTNDGPSERIILNSGSASADYYSTGPKREHLYSLNWKSGKATTKDQKNFYFVLSGVTGTIFEDGKAASTFRADTAVADQTVGNLTLSGSVTMKSLQSAGSDADEKTLNCEQMHYQDSDRIVRFSGEVTLSGKGFTLGPFPELWATPDLTTKVATPSLFPKLEMLAPVQTSERAVRHNGRQLGPRR
jgi:hypothetical protein